MLRLQTKRTRITVPLSFVASVIKDKLHYLFKGGLGTLLSITRSSGFLLSCLGASLTSINHGLLLLFIYKKVGNDICGISF